MIDFSIDTRIVTETICLSIHVVVRLQHFQTKTLRFFRSEGCETLVYFFTVTWFHYPLRASMIDYRYQ
jgi:hypothetical protein